MTDTITCPVCERPGVPAKSKTCPQCDADLTCFQALETLSASKALVVVQDPAQTAGKGSSGTRRAVLLLLLLLALIGVLFFLYALKTQDQSYELQQQVVALKTDLQVAEKENQMLCALPESERMGPREEESFEEDDPLVYAEDLAAEASSEKEGEKAGSGQKQEGQGAELVSENRERTEEAGNEVNNLEKAEVKVPVVEAVAKKKKPMPPVQMTEKSTLLPPEERWSAKTFLYLVKETDTLWDLAERFYGDGKYYPIIMEQNPGLIISDIQNEESLRLITDRAMLTEMYKQRIEWRDGMMLWKHTIRAGETRQAIEQRFAPPGFSGSVLYTKNPFIQSGAIIRVILQ